MILERHTLACFVGLAAAMAQDDAGQEQVLLRLETRPGEELRTVPLDLLRSFLRFDAAFFESHSDPALVGRLDRAFDAATGAFMQGRLEAAVRELNEVWTSTLETRSPEARLLAALRLEFAPMVVEAGSDDEFQMRLRSLYPVEMDSDVCAVPAQVRLLDAAGRSRRELGLQLVPDPSGRVDVQLPLRVPDDLDLPATLTVELAEQNGIVLGRASIAVLPAARESLLADWRSGVSRLELEGERAHAVSVFLDRCERFALPFEMGHERAFLLDLAGLARELESDFRQLESGRDPYAHRAGDLWRTWEVEGYRSPLRCFFPTTETTQAESQAPLPLVIALHGAGTSEDFWFEAFGAPLIELARRHAFLVAAPRTSDLMARPQAIDELLDQLLRVYPVDPDRVFLLGHSMGGMAAARIQATGSPRISGVVCIAGVSPLAEGAPVLVLAGELDPIVPLAQLEGVVAEAKQAGWPVRLQVFPERGHTVFLRDAIAHGLREIALLPMGRQQEQENGR